MSGQNGSWLRVSLAQIPVLDFVQCHQKHLSAAHWSGTNPIVQITWFTGTIQSPNSLTVIFFLSHSYFYSSIKFVIQHGLNENDTNCVHFIWKHVDYTDPKTADNVDDSCGFGRPADEGKYCPFKVQELSNCAPGKTSNKFGFPEKKPCVFLKLNKVSSRMLHHLDGRRINTKHKCLLNFRFTIGLHESSTKLTQVKSPMSSKKLNIEKCQTSWRMLLLRLEIQLRLAFEHFSLIIWMISMEIKTRIAYLMFWLVYSET